MIFFTFPVLGLPEVPEGSIKPLTFKRPYPDVDAHIDHVHVELGLLKLYFFSMHFQKIEKYRQITDFLDFKL